jgi:hypothetical protein
MDVNPAHRARPIGQRLAARAVAPRIAAARALRDLAWKRLTTFDPPESQLAESPSRLASEPTEEEFTFRIPLVTRDDLSDGERAQIGSVPRVLETIRSSDLPTLPSRLLFVIEEVEERLQNPEHGLDVRGWRIDPAGLVLVASPPIDMVLKLYREQLTPESRLPMGTLLSSSIEVLGLSRRVYKILHAWLPRASHAPPTVRQLVEMSEAEVMDIRGIGNGTRLAEIKAVLARNDLELGMLR